MSPYPTDAQYIMQTKWNEIQQMYLSQKLYSLFSANFIFPIMLEKGDKWTYLN